MKREPKRIPLAEFSDNLSSIIARVLSTNEEIVVESDSGELVAVRPVEPKVDRSLTERAYKAFRSAAGGWADMDTETLKKNIYESRKSSRPPVDL